MRTISDFIYFIKKREYQFIEWYLILIAFAIPVYKKTVPILIVATAIHTIADSGLKRFKNTGTISITHILSLAFYLLYVIGMLYTENIAPGLFDLQVKLSFIIFPLIFILQNKGKYIKIRAHLVYISFVVGCLLATLVALSHSIYISIHSQFAAEHFIYTELSFKLHPSYFSLYLNLAIFIVSELMIKSWNSLSTFKKISLIFIQLHFIIFIFFLNSKAGILILLMTLFPYLIYQVIRFKKYLLGFITMAIAIFLLGAIWIKVPAISTRIAFFVKKMVSYNQYEKDAYDSTTERLIIWRNSMQVINKTLPWGAGTGDGKKELVNNYIQTGFKYGAERGFNSHNQYFQTLISIGIPGLIMLLLIFTAIILTGIKNRDLLAILFTIMVLLHLSVESMFETQAGAVFIAFFISMFALKLQSNRPQINCRNH